MKCFRTLTNSCWPLIGVLLVVMLALTFSCARKQQEEIKIGAVLVLTGPDAKAGQSGRQGIEMAVEEINQQGGVRGRQVHVIYEDDQGDPQKATSAVLKLINVDKVPAIIGPMWSSPLLAVAPIAERNNVVMLSPTASNPDITDAGDFIFRNTYSDAFEGSKTAEYAYKKLGYRRVGIVYINNDFGLGLSEVFSKKFQGLGGNIPFVESYDSKSTDFRSQISKIKGAGVDAVYLVSYSEAGQFLRQARELGLKTSFLSTIMFEITDVAKVARDAAEGVVYAYVSYDPLMGGDLVKQFAEKFSQKYGTLPDPEAAFSYDAVKILTSVMSRTGFHPEDIKDGLYQVKDYHGVTGITTFDEKGDVIKPIGFKKVENGKYIWETFIFE